MKQRFWLFKRGLVFYLQDSETGKKESLKTRDPKQAGRLRAARNEAADKPRLGLTLGRAYLSAYDPNLIERKWSQSWRNPLGEVRNTRTSDGCAR